jgi:hypothetical protein
MPVDVTGDWTVIGVHRASRARGTKSAETRVAQHGPTECTRRIVRAVLRRAKRNAEGANDMATTQTGTGTSGTRASTAGGMQAGTGGQVPDTTYNLISVMYHTLQGCQTYEQYAQDAEQAGEQEIAQYFRETGRELERCAQKGQQLLVKCLQQGQGGSRGQLNSQMSGSPGQQSQSRSSSGQQSQSGSPSGQHGQSGSSSGQMGSSRGSSASGNLGSGSSNLSGSGSSRGSGSNQR